MASLTTYEIVLRKLNDEAAKLPEKCQTAVNVLNEALNALETRPTIAFLGQKGPFFFLIAMTIAANANNSALTDSIERLYASEKNGAKLHPFDAEPRFYGDYLVSKIYTIEFIEALDRHYHELVPRIVSVHRRLPMKRFNQLKRVSEK